MVMHWRDDIIVASKLFFPFYLHSSFILRNSQLHTSLIKDGKDKRWRFLHCTASVRHFLDCSTNTAATSPISVNPTREKPHY